MITAIGDYDRSVGPVVAAQQQAAEVVAAQETRAQAVKQETAPEEPVAEVEESIPPLAVEPRTYRFEFFPAVNTERLTRGGEETSREASAEAFEEAARERLQQQQVSAAYGDAKRILQEAI